jgi:hypothetical protein
VNDGQTILAIKKPQIYAGFLNCTTLTIDTNPTVLKVWTIQPAVNFDDPANRGGYAWLVAKGPPTHGTPYRGGAVYYRRLKWNANNQAELEDNTWQPIQEPTPTYRDYFDLEHGTVRAPQLEDPGDPVINLNLTGSRLMMAVIRNHQLWTCHHIGLDGPDPEYNSADATGEDVNRSGLQWLKFNVSVGGTNLAYADHGRVFDDCAPSMNPHWYYFPSLMVNQVGDMVMGFSGSSAESFIGAFYWWRLANGSSADRPVLLQAGQAHHGPFQFGDYSSTTLDPVDGLSFWTVQEFAKDEGATPDFWGTWIARLNLDP